MFSVKSARNLVKIIEETGCTCGRPRIGQPYVPVKVVADLRNTMTKGPFHTTIRVSLNLDVPKTI